MQIKGLHHVRFQARDLDSLEAFAADFGLITEERTSDRLVMRTSGGDECVYVAVKADKDSFEGFAFEVEDRASLDDAVTDLGASPVSELDLPGGGHFVSLVDPDGNKVLLVHGAARRAVGEAYPDLVHNTPFEKRRFGKNQSPRERGPARLWRIGHVGLFVRNFAQSTKWYAEKFGLIGSDVYHIPGQRQAQIVGFFRLDRGAGMLIIM